MIAAPPTTIAGSATGASVGRMKS